MYNMNSGYYGYSMSNRAVEAYSDGRKPLSQFNSYDVKYFNEELEDRGLDVRVKSLAAFKRLIKIYGYTGEWHHTGSYCRATDFYDPDRVLDRSDKDLAFAVNLSNQKPEKVKEEPVRYKANFEYIIWTGTRNRPKANVQYLRDVTIEEKGKYYYVYDDDNNFIVKKQRFSNGTTVYRK